MARTTIAGLLVETLYRASVRRVYGIIGTSIVDFIDELYRHRDRLRLVTTRHEQAAVSAADAEYRASRRLAAAAVHAGPGFLNTLISLGIAYRDRVPLVLVTGGVRRRLRGTNAWLEVDQEVIAGPVSMSYTVLDRPSEAPDRLLEALKPLRRTVRGPVVVEVPEDLWRAEVEVDEGYYREVEEAVTPGSTGEIPDGVSDRILDDLFSSRKPVIMATGELAYNPHYNPTSLLKLAEAAGAYIVTSGNGRGACPEDHELCLGRIGFGGGSIAADKTFEASDYVLVLGNEFDDITTYAYNMLPEGDVVVASLDPAVESRPQYYEHFKVDPVALLDSMTRALDGRRRGVPSEWRSMVEAYLREWRSMLEEARARRTRYANPARFFHALDEMLPKDRIIAGGQGTHILYTYNDMKVYNPGGFLAATNLGAMGYTIPAGIGAKLTRPGSEVLVVAGDGEAMMTIQELETIAREGVGVKIVVVNDYSYKVLYLRQVLQKQGRIYGTILGNPDFVELARSFGVKAVRVDGDDYDEAFKAIRGEGPVLVELVIDRDDIPPLNMDYTLRMSM